MDNARLLAAAGGAELIPSEWFHRRASRRPRGRAAGGQGSPRRHGPRGPRARPAAGGRRHRRPSRRDRGRRALMFNQFVDLKRIHFVGIGGIGMSGIAEVLLAHAASRSAAPTQRERASPSGCAELGATIDLRALARRTWHGADVVVISSAVDEDNPEVREAAPAGIPVIPRAEMLAELMRLKYGIAIAGTHGKTTTTSLVATVLHRGGARPHGGRRRQAAPRSAPTRALGAERLLVAEADESDGSFLQPARRRSRSSPTSIPSTSTLRRPRGGRRTPSSSSPTACRSTAGSILCLDHPNVQEILPRIEDAASSPTASRRRPTVGRGR